MILRLIVEIAPLMNYYVSFNIIQRWCLLSRFFILMIAILACSSFDLEVEEGEISSFIGFIVLHWIHHVLYHALFPFLYPDQLVAIDIPAFVVGYKVYYYKAEDYFLYILGLEAADLFLILVFADYILLLVYMAFFNIVDIAGLASYSVLDSYLDCYDFADFEVLSLVLILALDIIFAS